MVKSPVLTPRHYTAPLRGSTLGESEHEEQDQIGTPGQPSRGHTPTNGTADKCPIRDLRPRSRASSTRMAVQEESGRGTGLLIPDPSGNKQLQKAVVTTNPHSAFKSHYAKYSHFYPYVKSGRVLQSTASVPFLHC